MNWLHPISKDLLKIEELKNSKIHLLFELRICLRCVCEISVQMHDIFKEPMMHLRLLCKTSSREMIKKK